jgi:hypothetical protein
LYICPVQRFDVGQVLKMSVVWTDSSDGRLTARCCVVLHDPVGAVYPNKERKPAQDLPVGPPERQMVVAAYLLPSHIKGRTPKEKCGSELAPRKAGSPRSVPVSFTSPVPRIYTIHAHVLLPKIFQNSLLHCTLRVGLSFLVQLYHYRSLCLTASTLRTP